MKIHVFTHYDLDGVTSYLVASWFHPGATISYTSVSNANEIRENVLNFLGQHSFEDFDRVYFLDLDCYEAKDLIEHSNVFIIDHHEGHYNKIQESGKYKKAHTIVKIYPSCCKLLYKILSKLNDHIVLTKPQRSLVAIVDDYDSYTLKLKQSKLLNWVYFTYNNKFATFIARFNAGFNGFSLQEQSMIKIKQNQFHKIITSIELFKGSLGKYKILAGFCDDCINEVHDHIQKTYKPDISIIIIPKSQRVTWRKNPECDAPLHVFAEKICNGGGHEYAAGGDITEKFLNLTKTFEEFY